jgi:hypothetical protein
MCLVLSLAGWRGRSSGDENPSGLIVAIGRHLSPADRTRGRANGRFRRPEQADWPGPITCFRAAAGATLHIMARRRCQRTGPVSEARTVARTALLGGIGIMAAKLGVFFMTGSAAVLGDALESLVNIAASALVMFSVWYAARPADREHPYGHGKIEFVTAAVEGLLIILAAARRCRAWPWPRTASTWLPTR